MILSVTCTAVHVTDKITITGMGKMDVPVSDLGPPEDLMKIKEVDRLPHSIQKRTFLELVNSVNELGYETINHWPMINCLIPQFIN